jgi:hypothetical protein
MQSRKRNLEKVERVANSHTNDAPTEPRGYAAKYLRDLITKAERGELSKVKTATEEKRSKTWLEVEVENVAKRISHRAQNEGARGMMRDQRAQDEAKSTGADDELPEELLARLLGKTGLVSDKVH